MGAYNATETRRDSLLWEGYGLTEPYVFDMSSPGRRGVRMPASDVPDRPLDDLLPAKHRREAPPGFPELSELDVVRHFT
ncbi:MAG: hypothetical protein ABGY41_20960, partial [Candidatus Poribacteria bacterium]